MVKAGARGRGNHQIRPFVLLVLLAVSGSLGVFAQESTGTIRGVVADKDASPLPGVTVTVTNDKLGIKDLGTVTDLAGNFKIANLTPGEYLMTVSFPNFATYRVSVKVQAGRTQRQDITLRPEEELIDVVEVIGHTDKVELEKTDSSTTFDDTFIEGLPVVGRDYRDILVLAPGVNDEDGDGNVNIHGSRDRDVLVSVDGINVTDPFTGQDAIDVNLEAIGEIEVVSSGAGAEYGGKSGGFINLTTKSGTNDLEGAFKFFFRTSLLDGDGAGTDNPQLHGGLGEAAGFRDVDFQEFRPFLSLGGAIIQDKLWYFVSNEYLNIDTPINAVNQIFITNDEGFQEFAKLTWQATSAVKPALSFQYIPFTFTNRGLNSVTAAESAFDLDTQRSVLTLELPYIISPRMFLESTISYNNGAAERFGVSSPDLNGNGLQYRRPTDPAVCPGPACLDANRDFFIDDTEAPTAFFSPRYRDLGEDFNSNGRIDGPPAHAPNLPGICVENGEGRLVCEGDRVSTPGRPSFGNGDGILQPADRDLLIDIQQNRITGPNSLNFVDLKSDRLQVRSTLNQEIDDFFGTHTIKIGGNWENESFIRDLTQRPTLTRDAEGASTGSARTGGTLTAFVAIPGRIPNMNAEVDFYGLFVDEKYKPVPNLTVGLGVRFDRTQLASSGLSQFDPVREGEIFQRVAREINDKPRADLAQGLVATDPMLNSRERIAYNRNLITGAVNQFTANRLSEQFDSDNSFILQRQEVRKKNNGIDPNAQTFENFEITNNNLSPRLSFSWDPWANGKTKIYGNWGRFYDRIFLQAAIWEQNPATVTRDYLFDSDGFDDVTGLYNRNVGGKLTIAAPSTNMLDRGLDDPHSDEFTFGFEREIAPEFSVRVNYINRRWSDQLQDIDINHKILSKSVNSPEADVTGSLSCNTDGSSCTQQPDGLQDIQIYNLFFNQVLFLGNLNSQNYTGYELVLSRRQHRNWQMEASYIYSEATGAAEDFATEAGDDPTVTENEFGFLNFDQTHVIKFSATTFLPHDVQFGGSAEWSSGYPWSIIARRRSNDDVGYVTFRRRYPTLRRNDQRNDSIYTFNAHLKKSFVIGKISASAQLDIENILNEDDLRVFELDTSAVANQLNSTRRFGRRYEVGLILNF